MRADPSRKPTVDQSKRFDRWQEIGRHALRLERPSEARSLREVIAECRVLIVYEHWLAHAQNVTKTAEALGISRKCVREIVRAVENGSVTAGKAHDRCPP